MRGYGEHMASIRKEYIFGTWSECHVRRGKVLYCLFHYMYIAIFVPVCCMVYVLHCKQLTDIQVFQICTLTAEYGDGLHPPQPKINRVLGVQCTDKHSLKLRTLPTEVSSMQHSRSQTESSKTGARKVLGTAYAPKGKSFTVAAK